MAFTSLQPDSLIMKLRSLNWVFQMEKVKAVVARPFFWLVLVHFSLITRIHNDLSFLSKIGLVKVSFFLAIASFFYQFWKGEGHNPCKSKTPIPLLLLLFNLYAGLNILLTPPIGNRFDDTLIFCLSSFVVVILGYEINTRKRILVLTQVFIASSFFVACKILYTALTEKKTPGFRPILDNANGDPNLSAWIIGSSIPLCFYLYFEIFQGQKVERRRMSLILLGLTFLVLLAGLLGTESRSGLLVLLLSCSLMIFSGRAMAKKILLTLMVAVAILLWNPLNSERFGFLNIFSKRTVEARDPSFDHRVISMVTGSKMLRDNPWLGFGFLKSKHSMRIYEGLEHAWHILGLPIHNGWLYVLAECGIIGGLLYIFPFLFLLYLGVKIYFTRSLSLQERNRLCSMGAFSVFQILMLLTMPLPYSYQSLYPLAYIDSFFRTMKN